MSQRWPIYSEDEIQSVVDVLRSGKVNYWTGEQGKLLEQEWQEYLGMKHAIVVANGTNALELCLHALGVGPGDEVIVPCRTFFASASCVAEVGAKPVVCDVDPISQNLTVETIQPHLTSKTKAVIAVHLGGWPCDMTAIMAFAKAHQLYVIEDCAQATGGKLHGQPIGTFGDMAAFSFCQDKIISTMGEGGLVVTNNTDWWKKAWAYKDHGKSYDAVFHQDHPPGFRWVHQSFGSNYRMTEAQAAVGRLQLKKLDGWVKLRRHYAHIFDEAFRDLRGIRVSEPSEGFYHAYYRYYVFVNPGLLHEAWSRDRIVKELNAHQVPCLIGGCSEIYREKAFVESGLSLSDSLPSAKYLGETNIAILIDPSFSEAEVSKAAKKAAEIFKSAAR